MLEINQENSGSLQQRSGALSRWDNEGGAGPGGPHEGLALEKREFDVRPLTELEIIQLRVRVIALENLVIALLAHGSDQVITKSRELANHISPRSGTTQHRLTIHASTHMRDLIERSTHFQGDWSLWNPIETSGNQTHEN